jgi:hypothetical protein
MNKFCNSCEQNKDVENFKLTSNGRGLFGRTSTCIECQSKKDKKYRENNKEKIKEKRDDFYNTLEGKEKFKKYRKDYYENNKETLLPILLERQKRDRGKRNERARLKYNNNPIYKLKHNIRRGILKVLNGNLKNESTIEILGCSIIDFKLFIESKWENWMSWENYGKYKRVKKNMDGI